MKRKVLATILSITLSISMALPTFAYESVGGLDMAVIAEEEQNDAESEEMSDDSDAEDADSGSEETDDTGSEGSEAKEDTSDEDSETTLGEADSEENTEEENDALEMEQMADLPRK